MTILLPFEVDELGVGCQALLYCFIKKPAAQTAHLVFADMKANAEKTKRAVFCQRSKKN